MKRYLARLARWLRPLLQSEAVMIGVTVLNFTLVYLWAREDEALGIPFCFGPPWYLTTYLSPLPLLLLLAAVALYLGRRWAYLAAVAFCAPAVYQGAVSTWHALTTASGWGWVWYEPSLLLQYLLAGALMGMAVFSLARGAKR